MAGFLDKAKAAASELAAKADTALNNAGAAGGPDPATLYRDLGRMAYDEHAGRPVDPAAKARVIEALTALDQQGKLAPQAAPAGPPPPPGAAAAPPAPAPPPPPAAADAPPPPPTPEAPSATPPPPPPPSGWPST